MAMIASMAFRWGSKTYVKGASLPTMRESQRRHMKARGYAQDNATLIIGKPFSSGGTAFLRGGTAPDGLSDTVTRRLVSGRFLA